MSGSPSFTTRPELVGSFGVVGASHWLAAQSGMAMLERGGNAFDAAAAADQSVADQRAQIAAVDAYDRQVHSLDSITRAIDNERVRLQRITD